MAGPFDDLIEKYKPQAASSGAGPFDDLIEKAKVDRDPKVILDRIKTNPDFQPSEEQLGLAFKNRNEPLSLSSFWNGLKTFATETIPDLGRKARAENPNPLAFLTSPAAARKNLATGVEALLNGSQQLGQLALPGIHSVLDSVANGVVAPVPVNAPDMPEKMAQAAWLERVRAEAENQRAMQPYQEGTEAFVPGANPATAQIGANLGLDPTILIPGAKAAGLLKLAKPAARTAATVATEAAAKGGLSRAALQVAAPVAEAAAEKTGTLAEKTSEVIGKVQPVLDVGGFIKGGLPGAAGTRVAGTVARKAADWAAKVSKVGTGLRNLAAADWRSAQPVWQQLAKDADAPAWLVRASSSAVAPLVESTLRGASAVGKGAVEGTAIGVGAGLINDTMSSEERGMAAGPGALLGAAGAGFGHVAGTKQRALISQAHDIAVRADKTIKSGVDPILVLSAPDSVMFYADNVEKLFRGAMPGGKNLEVVLTDSKGFAALGGEPNAAASYVQTPDGRYVASINLESPSVLDTRAIHEGLGHAVLDSIAGDRPQLLQRTKEAFTPELLQRASLQYARALMPQASLRDIKGYIDAKRQESMAKHGDPDMWIAEELLAESAVRRFGGKSLLDMASPSFLSRVAAKLGGRTGEVVGAVDAAIKGAPAIEADRSTFFAGPVRSKLDQLGEFTQQSAETLGAFRPAIDTPPEPARPVKPADWGKPHAPLHDLGNGAKGNDFVVQTVHGKLVKRTPNQVKQTAEARRQTVEQNVPENAAPLPIGSPDDEVKMRTTPSGLRERSGRRLGKWFYDSKVFGKHTKEFARTLETAIKDGSVLAGWYHQIGKGKDWSSSVVSDRGNISAEYKDFVPVDFAVSKAGNILVRNYSLTSFQRKAQAWGAQHGDISLDLWNSDVATFKADVDAYLKNHEEGRPGDSGIGEAKRNVINAFLVGGNRSFEATNPLRPLLRGDNRQGIVRSYRLDRIETLEPSSQQFGRPQYEKQLKNLSPQIQNERSITQTPAPLAGNETATGELPVPGRLGGSPVGVEPQGATASLSTPLAGLADVVSVPGRGKVKFGPFPKAREIAQAYAQKAGIQYDPPKTYVKVDPQRASRIAQAFDAMPHTPDDPKVKASYDAMIKETVAQWEEIKKSGLVVEPIPDGMADPYAASPRLAILDVIENGHLWFFPTDYGFGGSGSAHIDISGNPLMQHTGEVLGGLKLRANDIFRIVHDYFGHIKEGVGFRADGEENAWRAHSAMYSELARPAMTTETRGQNSWVNFGPYSEFNKTASGAETQYAPQKIGLLPDWVITEGAKDMPASSPTVKKTVEDKAYEKAVQSGDMDAAQRFVDLAAKKAGYTIGPIFHGGKEFNKFDAAKPSTTTGRLAQSAFYFTSSLDNANFYDDGQVKRGFLRGNFREAGPGETHPPTALSDTILQNFQEDTNWDGVVIRDVLDGSHYSDIYAVIPNDEATTTLFKSSDPVTYDDAGNLIPLSKRFDESNPDIRYSPAIPKSRAEVSPAYLPANQREDFGNWQSTLVRTGKAAGEELAKDMVVTGDLYMAGLPEAKHGIVRNILADNPGMTDLPKSLPEARKIFTERGVENLLAIWDAIPDEIRSRSKLWYEGGRNIVDRLAQEYGVEPQQAAAVVAALSPQKGWQENVRLAHLIFEANAKLQDQQTTSKQLVFLRHSALAAAEKAVADESASLRDMQLRRMKLKNPKSIETAEKDITKQERSVAKQEAKRAILRKLIPEMEGRTLGQLSDDFARAMWIRSWWDGEMTLKDVPDITPEGEFLPTFALSEKGNPLTLRWQSYDAIEKTLTVIRSNDRAVVSDALGGAHKVRNFYNNLLLPNLKEMQDVTVDTHVIAAALFLPLGSSDFMVTWGMSGAPKSSTDVHGGYGFFADAYREAADKRGVLPREMQSVTWEGIRNLFSGSFKSSNKARIAEIWNRAVKGEITREQARQEIIAAAGGFKPPSWYQSQGK